MYLIFGKAKNVPTGSMTSSLPVELQAPAETLKLVRSYNTDH